ncbi:hypothetical protein HNQ65_003041 [Prosthecobacter vanneervenii]|uniref:Uncharacterized protein n=1 Tax=Prosthecobacter vanneervenii TaxID=48466 RepID=A0A7W8DKQ3_9BACT|nr:hypothetical protein [Prosthecobacter vanneervenii]
MPLLKFFLHLLRLDHELAESSVTGESPLAREGRLFWRNCGAVLVVLIILKSIGSSLG